MASLGQLVCDPTITSDKQRQARRMLQAIENNMRGHWNVAPRQMYTDTAQLWAEYRRGNYAVVLEKAPAIDKLAYDFHRTNNW